MEERIGLLENVSGHTYDMRYDLVFTTERLIVLVVQHPADVPYKFGVTELILGGQMAKHSERMDRRRIADERRRIYQEKGLDELVACHRLNFEIPYDAVTSARLTRGIFRPTLKLCLSGRSVGSRAVRFALAGNQIRAAREILDRVLPSA